MLRVIKYLKPIFIYSVKMEGINNSIANNKWQNARMSYNSPIKNKKEFILDNNNNILCKKNNTEMYLQYYMNNVQEYNNEEEFIDTPIEEDPSKSSILYFDDKIIPLYKSLKKNKSNI